MISIICNYCRRQYRIDENKIKGESARVKCKACGNIIAVTKPQPKKIHEPDLTFEKTAPFPPVDGSGIAKGAGRVSWLNSIQTRISAILIILTTAILFVFVLFNYYATKSRINSELDHFTRITAERLSKYLAEPLWGVEEERIEDSFNSEMMEKRIYGILVFDRDTKGVFMGKKRDDKNWNIIPAKSKIKGKFIKKRMSITRSGDIIGDVEVYVTFKFMEEELTRSVITIVIMAIVLNITIFFAIFVVFRNIIIQPIMKLTRVAERMSMGDLNVKIDIQSRNEVGLLVEAIKRMQTSLGMALDMLQDRKK